MRKTPRTNTNIIMPIDMDSGRFHFTAAICQLFRQSLTGNSSDNPTEVVIIAQIME
uniref:Uncharacterized protein n=1 Tax=Ascaris lumbricoides TaxID=6252 RepID=A0A0M3IMX7_ASCLU